MEENTDRRPASADAPLAESAPALTVPPASGKRCPSCKAVIESDDVAHFDAHDETARLEARIAALEKPAPASAPAHPAPESASSRWDFSNALFPED